MPFVSGRSNISIPWRQPTGAEAQMRAMGTVGTLFAIVNRTSNATAQVEWKLYRKHASGRPEDRVEVTQHAALDLINKPNPFFTRQELIETVQQHIDLTGEGWLVVARSPRSNIPLELWPVRPDRIAPIPHPIDFISGYMYTAPDGREIALRVEDVIQIRMPNPLDPYRGMGPVQSILTEIDASRYSAEWNRNFFLNSAEPGGIIEVPNGLSDGEFDELRERWNEQHKGVANAHRVAILEHGTWKDRKYTQRDMQFAELRSISRDVMREAYGAPAFVLGEVGDVNRATADASKALFAEQLTVPRLERFKGAFNNDLLALYGKDTARLLEFDYEDPVPPDAEARNAELKAKAEAAKHFVDMGFEAKSVAEALGLPEMEVVPAAGGDGLATPQQLADMIQSIYLGVGTVITWPEVREILNRAGAGLDLSVPEPVTIRRPGRGGIPVEPAEPIPAARLDLHHHVPAALPAGRQPSYNLAPVLGRQPVRAQADGDAALARVREQHEEALTALLEAWVPVAEAQYEALAEQIEAAVDGGDTEALATLVVDSAAGVKALRRALGDMAEQAAAQMAEEAAEQGVQVKPPKLDKALRNAFGSELIEIAVVTAGLLAADVAASAGREALRLLTPGAVGREVAEQVGGFLRGLKNWFRRDQLGGALHRAQNAGRVATLQAAPTARYFASEKNDSRRCDPCKDIDGTEFDDLDAVRAAYGTGGYLRCEGGVRCRGTVTAVWE
ncbi:phage portal protein [Streptomyces stelliscabiei]|uniref:phage portal protein n=1 Tax=Streptomyces stelliscabiei TaxID=146820 RepID=UPI0029AF4C72|nr:phage portal protein [Streptomyces stelliscabiei]MDX2513848.1 phage portal protein [Streptomyces stelliscabiei]